MQNSVSLRDSLSEHFVRFYEKDAFLLDEVCSFIGAGLQAGQAGIVLATPQHRMDLDRCLRARHGAALQAGRYLALDAAETLSRFMVNGEPDPQLFAEVIGDVLQQAAQNGRQVRAFGEMVALLWADGRHEAALRLEELWNDLARIHSFSLLCAYPMDGFHLAEHGSSFLHICDVHTQVRPAESFVEAADRDELHRQIVLLQQKAAALEAEIEKRKEVELLLRSRENELAESDRRKDEFLAMLGHELRNPLAAIMSSVELMRLSDNPRHLAHAQEIVARQATAMTRLVDDLLDVSRIARGKIQLRIETVLLGTIVERAVELVRPWIEERRHRLTVDLPAEPVLLSGDDARLVQVLANLLNNAAKYTDPGGNIELSARKEGTELLLCVRDDGIGLSAELRERMFEPFVQAQDSLGRAQGGLGLGLTLVRKLVDLHGGRIEARSDGPGHGSEFVVCLPIPLPIPLSTSSGFTSPV